MYTVQNSRQNPFSILQSGGAGSNTLGWSTGGGTKTQAATEPTHVDGVVLGQKRGMSRKLKKLSQFFTK